MLVKNLASWAGENFHHLPGATIELDDATALDRCEAGVASADADEIEAAKKRLATKPKTAPAK